MSLPALSKQPFRHPVPSEALDYFVHPRPGHHYSAPAWGRDAVLHCSNGWIATRFFGFSAAFGTAPQSLVDRLAKFPWRSRMDRLRDLPDQSTWRKMDDCTLDIFSAGVVPMWRDQRGGYRLDPCVRLNHAALIPCVSLQLISRLPACEICTEVSRGEPVAFRFRGGEGMMATLNHDQEQAATSPIAHIFPKQFDRF